MNTTEWPEIAMKTLFRRLFSPEYRRALSSEAAGDYLGAARSFALCGEHDKVADMHLARARHERTLEGQVRSLRTALDFALPDGAKRQFIARMLADRLGEKAAPLDPRSRAALSLRLEVAQLLERGEAWSEAAACYLALGEVDDAARCFGRAGMLDRVEQILDAREQAEQAERLVHDQSADYSLAMQQGARSRALDALEQCVAQTRDPRHYRALLDDLRARSIRQVGFASVGLMKPCCSSPSFLC